MQLDEARVIEFLSAIGEPTRLRILFAFEGNKLNVGEITSRFKISRPAISHHLKILKDAGVLQSEKLGQEVYYWVNKKFMIHELRSLADILESYIQPDESS